MKLIELLEQKLIRVDHYDPKTGKSDSLFTVTDGRGNYPLSKGNGVWFDDVSDSQYFEIDGKPKSKSKDLYIYKVGRSFGVYDDNFELVSDEFSNFDDAKDAYEEMK